MFIQTFLVILNVVKDLAKSLRVLSLALKNIKTSFIFLARLFVPLHQIEEL